ncbi:hypothetical protein EVAR_31205_1 [Eumeta japonica]|uniref:Uncharacterized protein n=1 Tax=Eumeta variegata TaxID=151549 RepID=A0A4C1VWW9_EUMVA|nr:hypothetical protein EVAR_31205_1 [Eumeta japonica]
MPRTQNNEDAGSDSIASPGTSNEICRLTTKIPPFWPEEPIIWFAQVEDSTYFELLADLADRVHEIAPPSLQVACTSTVSAHASTLENLTSEIAELRRQMRQLTTHSYRQLRPKSRGHPKDAHAASLVPDPTLATANILHAGITPDMRTRPINVSNHATSRRKHTGSR